MNTKPLKNTVNPSPQLGTNGATQLNPISVTDIAKSCSTISSHTTLAIPEPHASIFSNGNRAWDMLDVTHLSHFTDAAPAPKRATMHRKKAIWKTALMQPYSDIHRLMDAGVRPSPPSSITWTSLSTPKFVKQLKAQTSISKTTVSTVAIPHRRRPRHHSHRHRHHSRGAIAIPAAPSPFPRRHRHSRSTIAISVTPYCPPLCRRFVAVVAVVVAVVVFITASSHGRLVPLLRGRCPVVARSTGAVITQSLCGRHATDSHRRLRCRCAVAPSSGHRRAVATPSVVVVAVVVPPPRRLRRARIDPCGGGGGSVAAVMAAVAVRGTTRLRKKKKSRAEAESAAWEMLKKKLQCQLPTGSTGGTIARTQPTTTPSPVPWPPHTLTGDTALAQFLRYILQSPLFSQAPVAISASRHANPVASGLQPWQPITATSGPSSPPPTYRSGLQPIAAASDPSHRANAATTLPPHGVEFPPLRHRRRPTWRGTMTTDAEGDDDDAEGDDDDAAGATAARATVVTAARAAWRIGSGAAALLVL
ncbi:hypothetical protein EDB84DRAFT_1678542 [Lactarius hengduanensis]|nr:hypothetical protein EDB84DRAFT_1678542 [Lactarius hengduanensis]